MGGFIEAYNSWFVEGCFHDHVDTGAVGHLVAGHHDVFVGNHTFDAYFSNSIYGNSDTVTPKSTSCMLILKY